MGTQFLQTRRSFPKFEIHLFPKILAFAEQHGFAVVLAEHQNYYPDISFVCKDNESLKFAVDFKTTYRNPQKPWLCNRLYSWLAWQIF